MYFVSRGSGFPLLFIYGMPTYSSLWRSVIEQLRDGFRCIPADLPGLGQTPKIPNAPNPLEAPAEEVERVRQKRHINK
jgi:pimeloyl-ACP methyl ester carboxylesterase